MSWCVCKCVDPRLGEGSSSGGNDQKHVDGYPNAVRATFCGNLASVVCVSGKDLLCVVLPAMQHLRAQSIFFSGRFYCKDDFSTEGGARAGSNVFRYGREG